MHMHTYSNRLNPRCLFTLIMDRMKTKS